MNQPGISERFEFGKNRSSKEMRQMNCCVQRHYGVNQQGLSGN